MPLMPPLPIVIRIKNNSEREISNVRLFVHGANSANNFGNDEAIEISCVGDRTYEQVVASVCDVPITIGSTYSEAIKDVRQQMEPLIVLGVDSEEVSREVEIMWLKDPYRNQNSVLVNNIPYRIDSYTSVFYRTMRPNSEVQVMFIPANNINPASILNG